MKKIFLLTAAIAGIMTTGCQNDDDRFYPNGEGRLAITPEIKSDVNVVSRATDEESLNESLKLWISNSKGVIRKYEGLSNIPDYEWFLVGDYVAEAWAGDSVSASFDKRWFKGLEHFTIKKGETTPVTIACKIANVLVEVQYEGDVFQSLTDPKLVVGHNRGSLTYEGENPGVGYFMMPSTDKNLSWTLDAKGPNGDIHLENVIENAQPATKYILTVKATSEDSPVGGAYFDITVNTSEEPVYKEIWIELPPIIDGYDFDINGDNVLMQGEVGHRSIFVSASSEIVSASMRLAGLSHYLGMSGSFDDINFIPTSSTFMDEVARHGVYAILNSDTDTDTYTLKINFEPEFTNSLPAGEYVFHYEVEDAKGKVSTLDRTLYITNAPLMVNEVKDADVWATKATITAGILQDSYGNASFEYRKKGSAQWSKVSPVVNGKILSAALADLTPGETYEYRIVSDLNNFESEIKTFITESALQVPNASFEDWYTDGKVRIPGVDKSFWDSGNHGSATMNKNITDSSEDYAHSGKYSAKLVSQFVGIGIAGKFAAGNIFAGNYLYTDGTDGELGWGRPFTSRPTAIKAWVKYEPGTVVSGNNKGSGSHMAVGATDKGTIYAAIVDGTTSKYEQSKSDYNNTFWPAIVKTKTTQLFDRNGSNVIAIGEVIFNEATSGDGLVEITIPMKYLRTDAKGVYLIFVASASLYGDYFEGGEGSTLYLDDIEFVY